jgi:phosphate transport system substrate-binding protein
MERYAMKTIIRDKQFGLTPRGLLSSVSLMLIGTMVAGCPGSKPTPGAAPSGKITIRGSNTFGEELAPRLIAEYKKSHPAITFDLESKGTGYGFGALGGGFCDIAGASRLPSKDELEIAQFRNVEFNDHVIGAYSVAVVVNAANPVGNLTRAQVRDIFTGVIQNWKETGGPDAPVHLFIRDPVSGTYLGFRELAMENKPYAETTNLFLFTNYEGIADAVANDTNGIGYSSIEHEYVADVKPVSIDSIEPKAAAVDKGDYPYARVLHLYTSKGHETQEALDFIQFVLSPAGQAVLTRTGYTPHP